MGAELSLLAPTAPSIAVSAYIDVLDQIQYHKQMGSSRFLKTVKARDNDGSIVVKVFIKPPNEGSISSNITKLTYWAKRLQRERDILLRIPGVSPFQKILETDRAGYLIRQYFKTNLYDRISTRPFLKDIEKKWVVFQLLKAIEACHKIGIVHGDLKTENILVTTWNWILISDFASFKPVYLPIDNPSIFSFYFDTSQRRSCYLAPERFIQSNLDQQDSKLDLKMDIFSLGCVIAELFNDGAPTFTLSELFKYKNGEFQLPLTGIKDANLKEMVSTMLSVDPKQRLFASEYLKNFRGSLFPEFFYDFMYDFFSQICQPHPFKSIESSDDCDSRISYLYDNFDKIIQELGLNYNLPNSKDTERSRTEIIGAIEDILPIKLSLPGIPENYYLLTTNNSLNNSSYTPLSCDASLIFLSLVSTSLRNVKYELSKIKGMELILALSEHLNDEDKLDRCLPFIISLLDDPSVTVKTMAIKSLTQLVLLVDSITSTNIEVFPEYILPRLFTLLQDKSSYVRMIFANCFPYLAQISLRFHDYAKVLTLTSRLDTSVMLDSDIVTNSAVSKSLAFSFDASRQRLFTEFESLSISLLTDTDSSVKIALLRNILPLCSFFGQDRTNDLILLHLITYLNDKDPALRSVFIESAIGLSVYVGVTSLEHYILPLLVQTLTDPEELIVVKVLKSFQDLIKLGLIKREYIWELCGTFTKLILHPNDWIKQFSLQLIVDITENMSFADVYCILYPHLRQYIDYDVTEFTWESLYSITKRQISRPVYNLCLTWCNKACIGENSLFWRKTKNGKVDAFGNNGFQFSSVPVDFIGSARQSNKNHSIILGNSEVLLSSEDKIWIDKLIRCGISEQELWKVADFRDYIYRVSTLISRATNSQSSQYFNNVNVRDIGVLTKNVFFDTKRNNIDAGNFNTIDIAQLDERFQSLDIPESVNSIIDDRLMESSPSNSKMGFEMSRSASEEPSRSLIIGVSSKATPTLNTNDTNAYGEVGKQHRNKSNKTNTTNVTIKAQQLPIKTQSQITPISHSYIGKDTYILKFLNSVNFEPSLDEYEEFQKLPQRRRKSTNLKPDIHNWNPKGEIVSRLVEHEAAIKTIDIAPDHKVFITGDENGSLKIWDISKLEMNVSQESLVTVDLSSPVIKLKYLKNHNSFVVATKDGLVRIMTLKFSQTQPARRVKSTTNIEQVVIIRQLKLPKDNEYAVDFKVSKSSRSKHFLYITTTLSNIYTVDIKTMSIESTSSNDPFFGYITSFDIDDTDSWMIVGTSKGILSLWDLRFNMYLKSWSFTGKSSGIIHGLQVLPNYYQLSRKKGRFVIVNDGLNLFIIDISQGLIREVFEGNFIDSSSEIEKFYQLYEISSETEIKQSQDTSLKLTSFKLVESETEKESTKEIITSIHIIISTSEREFIIWNIQQPSQSIKFLNKSISDHCKFQGHQLNSNLRITKEYRIDSPIEKIVKSKNKLLQLQSCQDLKRHQDVITVMEIISNPYEMLVSCDRAGTIIVYK